MTVLSASRLLDIFCQMSGAGESSHSEPKQQISGVNGGLTRDSRHPPKSSEGLLRAAISTGRRNTCIETLGRCFVVERLSRSFVKLSCDGTELCLAMYRQCRLVMKRPRLTALAAHFLYHHTNYNLHDHSHHTTADQVTCHSAEVHSCASVAASGSK